MSRHDKSHPLLSTAGAGSGAGTGTGRKSLLTTRQNRCLTVALTITALMAMVHTSSPPQKISYHTLFLTLADNATAAGHLRALTLRPHVAGTAANSATAAYVLSSLSPFPAHLASYTVLLTYPSHRSLSLSPSPSSPHVPFTLDQSPSPHDPSAKYSSDVLPTFHAYAFSGTATGPVVFANYGRVEDFHFLCSIGVNVSGSIVIARYGKIYRGDIVRNAEDGGAIGAIIFTDGKDYGGGDGDWFPEGRGMPPSGVQVGSLYLAIGDPTTPGWASSGECERIGVEEVKRSGFVPGIPSLPVSARDGGEILKVVGGVLAPEEWQGAGIYHLGPGPAVLNLSYTGIEKLAEIHNVIAVIEGEEEPDRYVLLGNHRDAWTFGAVDPNSGTATLLEIAGRLEKLQKRGWRPRRTIVLCNWDAEEYGLIGSTEWVEENMEMLASRAVAYINVDCAVSGPGFYASATPQLDELLKEAMKQVQDPDNSSQTLYDSWSTSNATPAIDRLGGGGSDYAAFIQHAGVPSVDLSFGNGYPVYHSMYDDFLWMEKFGDPMFQRHVAVASTWGLVALKLADEEILPFDYISYASELETSTESMQNEVSGMAITFTPLYKSIKALKKAAATINNQRQELQRSRWTMNSSKKSSQVRDLNDRLMLAERAFTDRDGLLERQWYKHLIYGPSKHNDYGSKSFPGIDDAIDNAKRLNTTESIRSVQHEVWRVARAVTQAALVLNGKLT